MAKGTLLNSDQLALIIILATLPLIWLPHLLPLRCYLPIILFGWLLSYWRLAPAWARLRDVLRLASLVFLWANWQGQHVLEPLTSLTANSVLPMQVELTSLSSSLAKIDNNTSLPATSLARVISLNHQWLVPPLFVQLQTNEQMANHCAGQQWQLMARLRPIHSRLNPAGFDSQRWALANLRPLLATVKSAQLVKASCTWRQQLVFAVSKQLTGLPENSVLFALLFGDNQLMSAEIKTLFWQTGIAHLVAISGLHISLAALFGYWLARGSQLFFRQRWLGHRYPLIVSYLFALLYVWLAGANPPALRTLLALSCWYALRYRGVFCTTWQVWLACLAGLLLYQPLWVLSDSLWLSFLAVAVLIFWFQYYPLPHKWHAKRYFFLHWLHLEVGMMLLLMPIEIAIFHGISLSSLPANLWAVPIISLITVPLLLLALLLTAYAPLSSSIYLVADWSVQLALRPLSYLPAGFWPISHYYLPLSGLFWLVLLFWRNSYWQQHGILFCSLLYLLWLLPRVQPSNAWRITMIDVGHGLSIAIERHGHLLLYDTGDRWPGGDMASREIIPYLQWQQLQLDGIIISHSDKDHIGGLPSLLKQYPGVMVRTSFHHPGYLPCVQGQNWQWQQLHFTVLWPRQLTARADNNHSCVLKISDDHQHDVLLTGDLERKAEFQLAKHAAKQLKATVLQVPHHGSGSSSSITLLALVAGQVALSSSSRYNPWHFPADKVVQRYQQLHYRWQDTARVGQIRLTFHQNYWQLTNFRQQLQPRWYHQWFGVMPDNR